MHRHHLVILASLGPEAHACALVLAERALPALAWHTGAALIVALGLLGGGVRSALTAGVLALALPGVGLLALGVAVLPAWRRPTHGEVLRIRELPEPWPRTVVFDPGEGPLRGRSMRALLSREQPIATRMAAVMALRRLDGADAVPLLREALRDEHEDVRLLAYAVLEQREQRLSARIETHRRRLASARAPAQRALAERQLAALHYEFVRAGFAGGPSQRDTLLKARAHALSALRVSPHGPTFVLLARIALCCGDGRLAWAAARRAQATGVAASALAPIRADAAFLRRGTSPALTERLHASAQLAMPAKPAALPRAPGTRGPA